MTYCSILYFQKIKCYKRVLKKMQIFFKCFNNKTKITVKLYFILISINRFKVYAEGVREGLSYEKLIETVRDK